MIKLDEYLIEMHLPSIANKNDHWSNKKKIRDQQQNLIFFTLCNRGISSFLTPLHIVLTRHGRKMDSDNLVSCCKHVRDVLADMIFQNDTSRLSKQNDSDDTLISWEYKQAKRLYTKQDHLKIEIFTKRYQNV